MWTLLTYLVSSDPRPIIVPLSWVHAEKHPILSPVMLQLEQPQLIQSRDPFTSEPLCTVPLQTTLSATTISTCQRWSTGSAADWAVNHGRSRDRKWLKLGNPAGIRRSGSGPPGGGRTQGEPGPNGGEGKVERGERLAGGLAARR
ncbi:hypothetical protein GOODEAATRI_009320, partial [Goodea atripinnis]